MSTFDHLHFTIEPGPLLDACEDWRNRFLAHRYAAIALSESKGSDGVWSDTPDGATSGLSLVNPVPEGWVKRKAKHGGTYHMVPAKGPAGDAARAEIAALPPVPDPREIAKLIGHPGNDVSFDTADGRKFADAVVYLYYPAQLAWGANEKAPLQIIVSNLEPAIERIKTEYPGCTITKGSWTPPAGLTQITEAEAGLMIARSLIAHERSVAGVKDEPTTAEAPTANPARSMHRRRP